jgi:hypothetical protein
MTTKRRVFYSFHYDNDVFRVQQIRNIGVLEGNEPAKANAWENVKKAGIKAIEQWINDNLSGRSCLIVLVGNETAKRPWVRYEIQKAWKDGKGVLGIHIHNIKCAKTIKNNPNSSGKCSKGKNPFSTFKLDDTDFSNIVKCYDPELDDTYNDIKMNIDDWIEEAIYIRKNFKN